MPEIQGTGEVFTTASGLRAEVCTVAGWPVSLPCIGAKAVHTGAIKQTLKAGKKQLCENFYEDRLQIARAHLMIGGA